MSIIIGGLITLYVSRRYYVKASNDLREQTDNLRMLSVLTLRILDEAKLLPHNAEVIKDEQGNPTGGLAWNAEVSDQLCVSDSVTPRLTRDADYLTQESNKEEES